jgi:hypothetical protein
MMNHQALLLILELIKRTVELAPEVVELIRKAKAGEEVTVEEIEATEKQIEKAVSDWDAGGANL